MTRPRKKLRTRPARSVDPRACRFPLRLGRSPIHRFGLFAIAPIPARQRVIEYTGQRISLPEAQKRWDRLKRKMRASEKLPRVYFFRLNRKRVIDGSVGGSGAELINHSCSPNLRTRRIRGRVLFFSRRFIRKAEELTVDYRFPCEGPMFKCHCGSRKCRGTINRK